MAKLKILGDWKGAREALNSVEKHTKKMARSVKSSFAGISGIVSKFMSPLGLGLGGLGASTVFTTIVNRLDEIGKAASGLGVSAEYFQKMRFAAERTGTEINQVREAFAKVQALTGRFASGDASSAGIFAKLGISKAEIAKMNPEQVFDRINRGIAAIGNEQERNAISAKIYGETFLKLNNFLRDYVALGDEAASRGLIINDGAIKAAEELKDAMTNAGTAFMAALAGSGAVEWLNSMVQEINAQTRLPKTKKDAGVTTIDNRPWWRKAIEFNPISDATGLPNPMKAIGDRIWGIQDSVSSPRKGTQSKNEVYLSPERLEAIGGKEKLKEYMEAVNAAHAAIENLTTAEAFYINDSMGFEDLERRKAELLKKRSDIAEALRRSQELESAKASSRQNFGDMTEAEKSQIDNAASMEELYDAEAKITAERDKQKEQSEQRMKELERELKYQQMILQGKAREAEIEKALQREAKARGVEVENLDKASVDRISAAAGQLFDLRNPQKSAESMSSAISAPTDAMRRIGGISGSMITNPGLNYQRSSADSLKRLETTVAAVERKIGDNGNQFS